MTEMPRSDQLLATLDATWPPARLIVAGPWVLREGQGGGQRVSAATAESETSEADIGLAEKGMWDLRQRPLFMIREKETRLDTWLDRRGYEVVDPVVIYAAKTEAIAATQGKTVIATWPPLAIQRDIWKAGGVGSDRLAIMYRATAAKTSLLCRHHQTPAATAFVAEAGGVAMVHALEVAPALRNRGMGEIIMRAAASWAVSQGAAWLALAVTQANEAANALYRKLGMQACAAYHYRRAPEAPA